MCHVFHRLNAADMAFFRYICRKRNRMGKIDKYKVEVLRTDHIGDLAASDGGGGKEETASLPDVYVLLKDGRELDLDGLKAEGINSPDQVEGIVIAPLRMILSLDILDSLRQRVPTTVSDDFLPVFGETKVIVSETTGNKQEVYLDALSDFNGKVNTLICVEACGRKMDGTADITPSVSEECVRVVLAGEDGYCPSVGQLNLINQYIAEVDEIYFYFLWKNLSETKVHSSTRASHSNTFFYLYKWRENITFEAVGDVPLSVLVIADYEPSKRKSR